MVILYYNNSILNYYVVVCKLCPMYRNLVTSCKSQCWCERIPYARTLEKIVKNGFQEFYTGATAESLVNDTNNAACMELHSKNCSNTTRITMEEWQSYNAERRDPLQFDITGSANVMYTAPAPASGSALALFLGIMQGIHGCAWLCMYL